MNKPANHHAPVQFRYAYPRPMALVKISPAHPLGSGFMQYFDKISQNKQINLAVLTIKCYFLTNYVIFSNKRSGQC